MLAIMSTEEWFIDNFCSAFDLLKNTICSFLTGEKGAAYTLLTSADQNFSGDLVRNLVSSEMSFRQHTLCIGRLYEYDV